MEEKKEKKRRIAEKDWEKVERHLNQELDSRKTSGFRRFHEEIWREIDRQVAMKPMVKTDRNGAEVDPGWHNVFELGELAKASEDSVADISRICFPQARFWFESHSEIDFPLNPQTGEPKRDIKIQKMVDGRLRALMVQQHNDFGFQDRFELSMKEALHHGSFVAEVRWEEMDMIYEGEKVKSIGSPVWVPHSMWNCYPDPSPSVIGTNMFYNGGMFIISYMPRYKCEKLIKSGEDGWMPKRWKDIPKDEHKVKDVKTKDVEIATYWGDIVISRNDGDIHMPNSKAILFNKKLVYVAPQKLPYPELIYRGYERQDVRDPYYISPIIKQSPFQKLATILANKYVDSIELNIEPPIVYDGNDPDFVLNGGPVIAPGAKVSTKGSNSFQQVVIGEPAAALDGLKLAMSELKEKLGKPGRPLGDRATAAEVQKNAQDAEIGVVGFISRVERALRSYLYMQHEINKREITEYSFYCPEMDEPDFLRIKKADLPKSVHFEVVGAKGVLGEEQRSQKTQVWTAFLAGNPLFAPLLDTLEIAKQGYQDAGNKNPERFLKSDNQQIPPQVQQKLQQAGQMIQKLQADLQKAQAHEETKMKKIEADMQAKMAKIASDREIKLEEMKQEWKQHVDSLMQDRIQHSAQLNQEISRHVESMKADLVKHAMSQHTAQQKGKRVRAKKLGQGQWELEVSEG